MNLEETKSITMSFLAISFQLKALQKCLTDDQKIIYNASLEHSKELIEKGLVSSLSPQESFALLKSLQLI